MMIEVTEEQKRMLVELMHDKMYRPMKFKELCALLQVSKERRNELQAALDELIEEGKIAVSSHGKYGKPELFSLAGTFTASPRGFGFVQIEGREKDIFIPPDQTGGAMHGDTVLVAVTGGAQGSRREEGRILRVLKHGVTEVVGTYQKNKSFGFVIPDNKRIQQDIFIEPANSKNAGHGDKVVVRLTNYGSEHKNPEGVITEILGRKNEPGTDILAIVRAYEIPTEFPEDVQMQLKSIPQCISEEDAAGRMDLRSLPAVTIDGEDAKDLDDAITISYSDGLYHLGVHIADVSHYVTEGSPLDLEARKRGTSVYLIDRVIPMLPVQLSNGICSLNEGCDRLALSCLMDVDEKGTVVSHQIAETVIRVRHRMTYTMVASLLTEPKAEDQERYADVLGCFEQMKELSSILRGHRFSRGALNFDFPEAKITLDAKGRPTEIKPYERNLATDLIEDFMLLANETIAEEYFWLDLPFVYRIHEKPDPDRMRSFCTFINNFGYSLHGANGEIHPKELQKLLEKLEGNEAEPLISRILLRSMRQARYSPDNEGHFGLSARFYCHFTSPIRRYPDLQIHRIIHENLAGSMSQARIDHYRCLLPEVCETSSKTERRAQEAEREVEKLKKAQYMRRHLGEIYDGVISGVTAYGFYAELPNTVEGMVHISNLSGDYYVYREGSYELVGEMTGKTWRLGQHVRVIVNDVDLELKSVEFLVEPDFGMEMEEEVPEEFSSRQRKLAERGRHGKGKQKADRK